MSDSEQQVYLNSGNSHTGAPLVTDENVGRETDPLSLDVPDFDLARIIDKRIGEYTDYYKSNYDLFERRKKNEIYLFGRQISELEDNKQLKDYEARNNDNVLYEIERTIKPLAMSQLPDLIVVPGTNNDDSKKVAEMLTTAVNSDIKQRINRFVLGLAWKHRSAGFVGVIKVRWNPELYGGMGDYEFFNVHYSAVEFDHTATTADVDKMSFVSHLEHTDVQHVLMRFPKKRAEFIEQLKRDGIVAKTDEVPSWKALATPIDIREVWFTDYQEAGEEKREEDEAKWERIEGVCWKYKDVILGKMKNPLFDYEGETQVFTYDDPMLASSKRLLTEGYMSKALATGIYPQNVSEEQVYRNYFESPRKPFFFMVYDQWGKQPIDETTHLEQNLRNQDTLDKRAKQIEETLNHRGHHIWSKLGGFKPADVQRMDHNNPDQDYLVDGIPNQVHEFVPPERPTVQEFNDLDRTRDRMYALSSSTAVRGQLQSDVATTNQIGREANYTVMDDMVEDTINAAAEWMAVWALHMIKTRYTQEHFRKLLGHDGEVIWLSLHQNMIEDGMEVRIKSSGTDKIKRQNNAMNMAKMQLIDPLSFYEDMDLDDPEGRAAKIIAFKADMPLYLAEFVTKGPTATQELAQKLMSISGGVPMPGQMGGQPAPTNPQLPAPGNTAPVAAAPQPGVAAAPQPGL